VVRRSGWLRKEGEDGAVDGGLMADGIDFSIFSSRQGRRRIRTLTRYRTALSESESLVKMKFQFQRPFFVHYVRFYRRLERSSALVLW
jgi:hypothetical protein